MTTPVPADAPVRAPADPAVSAVLPRVPALQVQVAPTPPGTAMQKLVGQVSPALGAAGCVYLASIHAITGREALVGLLVLLLPLELTRRIVGLLHARLGATGTVAGAATAVAVASKLQTGAGAAMLGISLLAGFAHGCELPRPDGCTPRDTRCSPAGIPEVCSASQRWTHGATTPACGTWGAGITCCLARTPYDGVRHACVPPTACLPETSSAAPDAGRE